MRREGRLRGKPTNKSRSQGRGGTVYRLHPVEKSNDKSKGRYKRLAADLSINPRLAEFLFQPLKELHPDGFDITDDLVLSDEDDSGAVQLGTLAVTVNSIIEAALGRVQGDNWEVDHGARTADCEEGSTGSEERWSEIELSESDPDSLVMSDDDWSLVDEEYGVI